MQDPSLLGAMGLPVKEVGRAFYYSYDRSSRCESIHLQSVGPVFSMSINNTNAHCSKLDQWFLKMIWSEVLIPLSMPY